MASFISLLLATSSAAASTGCTPSTIYVPVTELITTTTTLPASTTTTTMTVQQTSYLTVTQAQASSAVPTTTLTTTLTVPSTSYLTVFTTMSPDSQASFDPASATSGPFSYFVSSGSTIWLGATPSSGQSLKQATATIFVTMSNPNGGASALPTYSVPPFTSTSFSLNPATLTSTRTSYVTSYLSYAPSSLGDASLGADPSTTATQMVYSPGDALSSTTTTYLTLTSSVTTTTTMTLSGSSAQGPPVPITSTIFYPGASSPSGSPPAYGPPPASTSALAGSDPSVYGPQPASTSVLAGSSSTSYSSTSRYYADSTISIVSTVSNGIPSSQSSNGLSTLLSAAGISTVSISTVSIGIPSSQSTTGLSIPLSTTGSLSVAGGQTGFPSMTAANSTLLSSGSMTTITMTGASSPTAKTTSDSSTSSAVPAASQERFTLGFDDLPIFSAGNSTGIMNRPPIGVGGLYNHLSFNGYVYAPSSVEPFSPISSPNVAVFLARQTGMTVGPPNSTQSINGTKPGEINDPLPMNPAFYFQPYSAYAGCDNAGPRPCTLYMTGYTWNSAQQTELPSYTSNVTIAPCPGMTNCQLQEITFPASFQALSGLQMLAYVDTTPVIFYLDNLVMGWTNVAPVASKIRSQAV